jgi:hypothetical protein
VIQEPGERRNHDEAERDDDGKAEAEPLGCVDQELHSGYLGVRAGWLSARRRSNAKQGVEGTDRDHPGNDQDDADVSPDSDHARAGERDKQQAHQDAKSAIDVADVELTHESLALVECSPFLHSRHHPAWNHHQQQRRREADATGTERERARLAGVDDGRIGLMNITRMTRGPR